MQVAEKMTANLGKKQNANGANEKPNALRAPRMGPAQPGPGAAKGGLALSASGREGGCLRPRMACRTRPPVLPPAPIRTNPFAPFQAPAGRIRAIRVLLFIPIQVPKCRARILAVNLVFWVRPRPRCVSSRLSAFALNQFPAAASMRSRRTRILPYSRFFISTVVSPIFRTTPPMAWLPT